jgi:hypothetical protein
MARSLADHPRLALCALAASDLLLFVFVTPERGGFTLGLTASGLGLVLVGLDLLLGLGILLRGAWARELARYRCWLTAAYLGFAWLVYLMAQESLANLEMARAQLAAMLRDGLVLVLLALAFLMLREPPAASRPAGDITSDPGPPSDPS